MNIMILCILKKKAKIMYIYVDIRVYGHKRSEMGKEVAWARRDKKRNSFFTLQTVAGSRFFTTTYVFSSMNSTIDVRSEKGRRREEKEEVKTMPMPCSSSVAPLDGHVLQECAWLSGSSPISRPVSAAHYVYRCLLFKEHIKLFCPQILPALRVIRAFQD